jgi:hypothetical protein
VDSAPRIGPRLLRAIERLAAKDWPIAEINRRVGAEAEALGVPRPSYERVRMLVHRTRRLRRQPTLAEVAVDVAFRARPPDAILDHVSGVGNPRLRGR